MLRVYGVGRGKCTSPPANSQADVKRRTPGQIRMQKELEDLEPPPGFSLEFPDKNDLMAFQVTVKPQSGYWKLGTFIFSFTIPETYPHDPPKAKCLTKIYHPNIDEDGNICLNILREDWKPVLSLNGILYGLLHLFLEPNTNNPLNQEAADMLATRPQHFARLVNATIYENR